MSWTLDQVMAVFGDEVQVTAAGLIVLADEPGKTPDEPTRLKHVLIGKFVDHSFVVTEDGLRLLNHKEATDVEIVSETKKPAGLKKPAAPKKTKVKEEVVESEPESDLDDLDLS